MSSDRGPGKYNKLAVYVRSQADAEGAIVIVINGNKGSGVSVQASDAVNVRIPNILRKVADDIDKDRWQRALN